jgi:hypothetical protein
MEYCGPRVPEQHGARNCANRTVERSVASLDARSRQQFEEVYAAILALMGPATTAQ